MPLQTVVHRSPGGTRENISWFTYIFESLRILGYTNYTIQTKTWNKTITPGVWKDVYRSFLFLTWPLPGSSTPPWFLIRWWSRTISTSTAMIFEQPLWGPVILQEAGLLHFADVPSQHPPCQDHPPESCNSKGWKLVHPPWTAMCPKSGSPKWLPHIKISNMFLKCSCGYQIRPCTDEHSQNGMMFSGAGNGFIFFCPHLMVAVPKKTRSFRNGASLSNCTASGTPNRDQNSQKNVNKS